MVTTWVSVGTLRIMGSCQADVMVMVGTLRISWREVGGARRGLILSILSTGTRHVSNPSHPSFHHRSQLTEISRVFLISGILVFLFLDKECFGKTNNSIFQTRELPEVQLWFALFCEI